MTNRFVLHVMYCLAAFTMSACGSGGDSTTWTVSGAKALTAFSIASPAVTGVIDQGAMTIKAFVPYGTDLTALTALFTTTGASVTVGSALQQSGVTVNDFTNPLTYTVTAKDGSTATYTVRVTLGNYVHLESDSGDYIGLGNTYTFTQASAVLGNNATGTLLTTTVQGNQSWWGYFQVPNTLSQLQTGTYSNLTRYPFNSPTAGGLSWSGDGRGCNTLTGWFAVDKVSYNNGNLDALDLRFEQHCEGAAAALHGWIHWTPDDTTTPPGPVNPPPAGLWHPASGSTPATGNYVYLQSDAGDYIGAGKTYTYTPGSTTVTLGITGNLLNVNINGTDLWYGDFKTMNSLTQLQPGYYGNLMRYPFNNPVRGGLSWSGNGRGCNTLTGWFVVDNVNYNNGTLSAIDLRFEQHCDGGTSALHGQIHWLQ